MRQCGDRFGASGGEPVASAPRSATSSYFEAPTLLCRTTNTGHGAWCTT
jgi:hypothetical protein